MTVNRQFANAVGWMAFGNWTEQAINFAVFVLLARLLGAESFGLLAMVGVFVVMAEFLVRLTVSEILISTKDPPPGYFQTAFWILTVMGFGLAVLLFILSGAIATFYGEPEVKRLLQGLCLTVPITALTAVPVSILRREMRFRVLSLRAIAGVVAGGVVGVGMALSGYGVWALIAQRLVQVGVNDLLAWTAVAWRPRLLFDRDAARKIGHMGFLLVLHRAGEIATIQLPILIVGATSGPVAAGLFYIAWRLIELSSFLISNPIRMAAQPAFAAITRQGERASDLLQQIGRLTGFVALPAYGGMAVLAGPLLILVFGLKWIDAVWVLALMAPLGAYLTIEKMNQVFCLAAGRVQAMSLLTWIEVAVASGATLIALRWSIEAAALALPLSLLAIWPFRLGIAGHIAGTGATALALPHLGPLVATLAMMAGVGLLIPTLDAYPLTAQLVAGTLAGVIIYGGLTAVFMRDRIALAVAFLRGMRSTENFEKKLDKLPR